MWLNKLDIVSVLSQECPERLKRTREYIFLVTNLAFLVKSEELGAVSLDLFMKVVKENLSTVIMQYFMQSEQLNERSEAVYFFMKYYYQLSRLTEAGTYEDTVELELNNALYRLDLLNVLTQNVFEQAAIINKEVLSTAIEIVLFVLRTAAMLRSEPVFEMFEKQGCLDAIENLQSFPSELVRTKSLTVVDFYQNLEDHFGGQAAPNESSSLLKTEADQFSTSNVLSHNDGPAAK